MSGINRHTGRALEGGAHLGQSVVDVLSTPRGEMVTLRDYGSDVPGLIDQPMNGETMVDLFMATAEALERWEPRIDLAHIKVIEATPGRAVIELTDAQGKLLPIELGGGPA
jgi:phage baseplate assembly protein W